MRDPREEQAYQEVGRTDVAPWLAHALVTWFLVVLTVLPLVEIVGARQSRDPGETSPWATLRVLPGEMRAAAARATGTSLFWDRIVPANREALRALSTFETDLEDQSSVGRLLRPPAQTVLSGWFGAGNERVYVGRDGWLFYRPDVEYVTGRGFLDPAELARRVARASEFETAPAPDPRPAILQFARDLLARGITLVLVPTPGKPVVHPERLSSRASLAATGATVQNLSWDAFVEEMSGGGVLVFDTVPAMMDAGRQTGSPRYLATDTHWRPEAMEAAARALAAFIADRVALAPAPPEGYRAEPRETRQTGDTAAMLDLPEGQSLFPPETVPLRMVLRPDGDPWRPTRGADVLVLGDSFSNIYSLPSMGWGEAAGFVEHLSLALDRPVDRLVQNDNGASATRLMLAREAGERLAATRVVVWQFAARELAFGDWLMIW
jgi:alginate O-acetyltransferase complex protein AlgJ